jgi:CheY-like chemotaxis protein
MAEPEPPEAISARKLVLETSKFNVLTAYSGEEATELLRIFPTVQALVLHSGIHDVPCQDLVRSTKQAYPKLPIILLATHMGVTCEGVDHRISSHSPEHLVQLLRDLFGDPRPPQQRPTR